MMRIEEQQRTSSQSTNAQKTLYVLDTFTFFSEMPIDITSISRQNK